MTSDSHPGFACARLLPALLLAAGLLSACASLAPDYVPPALPVPAQWPVETEAQMHAAGETDAEATQLHWTEYFTDPRLRQLIASALEHNRELRTAALRVEEVAAAYAIQRAERLPTVAAAGQGARARTPDSLAPTGQSFVGSEYRAEVGISSWELDLWGRVRNLESAALESWLATDAARQAVRVALIAQVANAYLGLRELDERVAIAERTVASREESNRIFRRRFEVGAISRLEQMQVETLLTQAQSLHAQLARQRADQRHALALLVGHDPDLLPAAEPFDRSSVMAELQPALPSALLHSRPDIIAAEHRLRAADAHIGAARAAYFPRIALTAAVGVASSELDGLFEAGSRAWAFMPVISLPIFDGGRRHAQLARSEVQREIALSEYEWAIQTAFREVWDALSARHWLQRDLQVQRRALEVQTERARLAQLRYDNGSAAYLEVLDAERDLLSGQQQLVQARRALLSAQVALYVALGGGTEEPPAATATP